MNRDLMFSSNKSDWTTPRGLFESLDNEFHFTVDLCADSKNHLCDKYYSKENDGMTADISGEVVFCNPPYGRKQTAAWIKRCATANARTIVMLIPARTDTNAFHDYIYGKAEIRFLRGRLCFSEAKNPAPFPSMVVIFRRGEDDPSTGD